MEQNDWTEVIKFSRSEQRGITVLIFLCLFSIAYSYIIPEMISRREIRKFEQELRTFQSIHAATSKSEGPKELAIPIVPDSPESKTKSSTDHQKHFTAVKEKPSSKRQELIPAEDLNKEIWINSISAKEIIRKKVMPDKLAYRLVRLREGLGGFHSISQLKDIYEMTDTIYNRVKESLVLERVEIKKIPVNSATLEELQTNPYISKGLANQIINFREKVKVFESSEDLLRLYFMDEILLEKLLPYLSFY